MPTYREVTKTEFFDAIDQLNVHPSPVGSFPYTFLWKTPRGSIKGKSVDRLNPRLPTRYYLTTPR